MFLRDSRWGDIMKCMILAAGYATRLYPLTEHFPKPLLEVKGKTIIDWLIADVEETGRVDEYVIVSNHKFIDIFKEWKEKHILKNKITVLDDGSTCNEDRLGAVKDISWAVREDGIQDDLMVLAGDNLLDFSLKSFVEYFEGKAATCVMRHSEPAKEKLQRTGVAVIDDQDLILEMEEKPEEPKSHWAVPPFYLYRKEDLDKIDQGLQAGCSADAPGGLITWLCGQIPVYAMEMPGKRYDIGNLESYEEIKRTYRG